jgi:cytochrome c biogenesis protein CcdA
MLCFYALLGAITGFIEPLFGFEPAEFKVIGAVLMILTGLILLLPHFLTSFRVLYSGVLNYLNKRAATLSFESPLSCLLMGAMLSLIWAPCAGPMLASAFTLLTSGLLAHESSDLKGILQGSLLLSVYGVGAAFPLVLLAYLTRTAFSRWRPALLKTQSVLTKALGIFFLIFGVLILSGAMKALEVYLLRLLPEPWLGFVNSI